MPTDFGWSAARVSLWPVCTLTDMFKCREKVGAAIGIISTADMLVMIAINIKKISSRKSSAPVSPAAFVLLIADFLLSMYAFQLPLQIFKQTS